MGMNIFPAHLGSNHHPALLPWGTKQRRAVSHFPPFEIQEEQGLAFLQTKLCVPVKINPKETPD